MAALPAPRCRPRAPAATLALLAATLAGAGQGEPVLVAAGASLPAPLYHAWAERYEALTGVRLDNRSVGSGTGVDQLLAGTVEVAGTDVPLEQLDLGPAGDGLVMVPSCISALGVVYNLSLQRPLRLAPELVADLFSGRLARWVEPSLVRLNPRASLPDLEVAVVHRSDRSGTTFIFSDYLTRASQGWAREMGRSSRLRWPSGLGVEGNERLVELVNRVPGAVGYTPLAYAASTGLPCALLEVSPGVFASPSEPGEPRYPLAGLSYLTLLRDQARGGRSREHAIALARFVSWAVHDGQRLSAELGYQPLPPATVRAAEHALRQIRYGEAPLLPPAGSAPAEG